MKNRDFIFNVDFNLAEVPINVQTKEAHITKSYTEDELKNARSEGHLTGFARGFEEGSVHGELNALTKNQQHLQTAFINIYKDIGTLVQHERTYEIELIQTVMRLSASILKKVFPHYLSKYGGDEMEHAVRYILSTLLDHQDISIFLAANTTDDIRECIMDIQSHHTNKITLHIDDDLKEWECRVEWKGGGARWNQPDLLNTIHELCARLALSTDSNESNKEISK
ncbi:MAG: hypothetical protein V4482_01400 [Pseudomonadota bacterium]